MNKKQVIKRQIDKLGTTVQLIDGEWSSMPFKAFVSPLWRRKSSNFEARITEIGSSNHEYYLFIASFEHNICRLTPDVILRCDGEIFEFKHRDKVVAGDETIYYNGILRRLKGVSIDEA